MQTEFFDHRLVSRLRRAAQRAAQLPARLPKGWCASPVDPARIVAVFPALRVKAGFTLRGYLFTSDDNGNGIVWAVPNAAELPEPDTCQTVPGRMHDPPKPPGAIDPMAAIEGDGTPLAYLSASLLVRELAEFGARWHGCSWTTHKLVCRDPWTHPVPKSMASEFTRDPDGWTWTGARPAEWRAQVTVHDNVCTVSFHTFTALMQESIIRHTDCYRHGFYLPESAEETLATGQGGYIF